MTKTRSGSPTRIAIIRGDGTGAETLREVRRILDWFVAFRALDVAIEEPLYGLAAYQEHGSLLSSDDLRRLHDVDIILFGAAGGPEYDPVYDHLPREVRRTGSALRLRKELGLFANLRPIRPLSASAEASSLKPEALRDVDLLIVRELLGGLYFGEPRGVESLPNGDRRAINTHVYLASQVRAIAEVAFENARRRQGRVCSVEKAAVMEAGLLWREEVEAVHARYPEVALEHMAIDTCAQLIVQTPRHFDVIVTDNTFGDILSDCASAIVGSVGYQASACLGGPRPGRSPLGLYEPLDMSDFHLTGLDQCNPVGAILSLAMALEISMGRPEDSALLNKAVDMALATGLRTVDVAPAGAAPAATSQVGDAVLAALQRAHDQADRAPAAGGSGHPLGSPA